MLEVERLQMNDQILTAKIVFLKNDVERLNARIEALETALREIAKGLPESGSIYELVTVARTALAAEQEK
jgi:hypothetical protein